MTQISEDLLRQILQFLWQQHVAGEQQYLYWILLAPIIALFMFIILWIKHKAHVYSLLDAISFFFAPRGPERMLIFKDLLGNRILIYDYKVVKGEKGYVIQAGPYTLKTSEDPESYAEPVSLLDARGPPGVPSPFGLWVRQLIASYVMLALIAISFANTIWITWTVYVPVLNVALTSVDLLSFTALVLSLSWFLAVLLRALSPQTLLISLSAIGMSEGYIEASPALDVYSKFPPVKLLKSISREPKVNVNIEFTVVSEEERKKKETIWDKLVDELGDRTLAASLLALLGQIYDIWRKSLGLLLQDRYDISVAAKARYHLEEVKIPKGFLQRYSGVLALLAIVLVIILTILWLQPSVQPANTTINTTTVATGVPGYITPAQPPPPPQSHTITITPAQPPQPSTSIGG